MNMHTRMAEAQSDRLIELPHKILDQILSGLRTKEVAQTCIISKRWRNLWASLSCISIDETDFLNGDMKERHAKFEKFGDMVFSQRENYSDIHTIKIRFSDLNFSDLVRTWITSFMQFKPRVVYIEVRLPDPNFFQTIYTCASIEEMSLKIYGFNCWSSLPKAINLPCIRRLSLENTRFQEKGLTRLFSGCPVLEELSLDTCQGDLSPIFDQKRLICLSLIDCAYHKGDHEIWTTRLSYSLTKIVDLPCIRRVHLRQACLDDESVGKFLAGCPLLEDLSLENCFGEYLTLFKKKIKHFSMESCCMETLEDEASWKIEAAEVRTNLCGSTTKTTILIECTLHPFQNTCHPFLLKFICDSPVEISPNFYNDSVFPAIFSGVESLEICAPDCKVNLKKVLRRIGTFYNLKKLSVRLANWCMNPYEFDVVEWLLRNSPELEQLTLYNPKSKKDKSKKVLLPQEAAYYNSLSVKLSLCKKLKRVEIKFCKHTLMSVHNFKEAFLQDMHGLRDVKVVLSEFDE